MLGGWNVCLGGDGERGKWSECVGLCSGLRCGLRGRRDDPDGVRTCLDCASAMIVVVLGMRVSCNLRFLPAAQLDRGMTYRLAHVATEQPGLPQPGPFWPPPSSEPSLREEEPTIR